MANKQNFDPIDMYRQASLQNKASRKNLNELRQMAVAALEVMLKIRGEKEDFKGYITYRDYAIHTWVQIEATFDLNTRLNDERPAQLRMLKQMEHDQKKVLLEIRQQMAELQKSLCRDYPDSESVKGKRYLQFVDSIPAKSNKRK